MEQLTTKLLKQFQKACEERCTKITEILLTERDSPHPNFAQFHPISRELHTLKGEARMLMLSDISGIIHTLEEKFQEIQRNEAWSTSPDLLLRSLDIIQEIADAKADGKEMPIAEIAQIQKALEDGVLPPSASSLPSAEPPSEETPSEDIKEPSMSQELILEFCKMYPKRLGRIQNLLSSLQGTIIPDYKKIQMILAEATAMKGDTKFLGLPDVVEQFHVLLEKLQQIQRHRMWETSPEVLLTKLAALQSMLDTKLQEKYSFKAKKETSKVEPIPLEKEQESHPKEEEKKAAFPKETTRKERSSTAAPKEQEEDITKVVEDESEHESEKGKEKEKNPSLEEKIFADPEKEKIEFLPKTQKMPTQTRTPETIKTEKKPYLDKKNLAKGTLSIEIQKLEALGSQIEKIATLLIFFANLLKNNQPSLAFLKEISQQMKKMSYQIERGESWLLKEWKVLFSQILKYQSLQEKFQEQSSNFLFDLECSTEELMDQNIAFRLIPLSYVVQYLHRGIYEISKSREKEVKLVTSGMETEVERNILENFMEMSVHIIRNAIDHGIEPPDKRLALGKNRCGTITIQARTKGREVEITLSDDGQGLDPAILGQKALDLHLIDAAKLKTMTDKEKMELIFMSGFTTRKEADQISGRGIGLDIVKNTLETIDGKIHLLSEKGKGTSFVLQIPITLAKLSTLVVKAGELLLCIAHYYVEEVMYLKYDEIQTIGGQKTIAIHGKNITLQSLQEKLGMPSTNSENTNQKRIPVVVLKIQEDTYCAFVVDKFLGEREVILKPFNCFLKKYRLFSATTLLDEGELAYILNVNKLLQESPKIADAPLVQAKKKILLVEDSAITREMEKVILETYGYEVIEAENGKIAIEILEREKPNLMITDIEMPELGGLELTQYVRRDKKYQFPIIIVSTKGAPKDLLAGVEAGADAYILKGEFHKQGFIETVQKWL